MFARIGDFEHDVPPDTICRVAAFEALTPEQQAQHRAEQRRSWVVGELMLSNPDMTRERAEQIVDRVRSEAA